MRVRHPIADADDGVVDDRINVAGETVPIDDDGTFAVPDDATSWLQRWCDVNGYDYDDVLVSAENGASADSAGDTSHGSDEDEPHTCAGSTADGSPCTREVDDPGAYCYQHAED